MCSAETAWKKKMSCGVPGHCSAETEEIFRRSDLRRGASRGYYFLSFVAMKCGVGRVNVKATLRWKWGKLNSPHLSVGGEKIKCKFPLLKF